MSTKHKTTQTTNQTQTNAPPDFTAPGLSQAAGMVTDALSSIPTSHYSGQQVAYMSPQELAAIQNAYGTTAGQAGYYSDFMGSQLPQLSQLYRYTTQLPTTSFDVGQLQDVNPVIDAALRPMYEQLTQQILPGIKSSALDSGAYSNDRAIATMPLEALNQYTRNAGDTAATIGYQNYNDYENRRLAAFTADQDRLLNDYQAETQRGAAQNASQTQMMASLGDYVNNILHTSSSVGDLLRMGSELGVANNQAAINDALARDQYASYSPFMGLDQASNLLATLSGNYGTQNVDGTTTTTQKTSGLGEVLKGAIGLASLAMGIPGVGPALGLGGAAAGAGGIASTFSGMSNPNIFPLASSVFGGNGG